MPTARKEADVAELSRMVDRSVVAISTSYRGLSVAEMTALHGAVICNQPSIVKYLIEQGAEVNARNRLGWTPLMIAGGLYIANAHKTSPGSAEILRQALAAKGLSGR